VSDENKRLARRALEEIYAKGDLEVVDELVHPEFTDHEPAHPDLPVGPDAVRQTVQRLHETFSDSASRCSRRSPRATASSSWSR
jgi:hypothetical protein